MSKPYISYVQPKDMTDKAMLAELDRCKSYGTPRPESQAIRAHVPAVFWSFANSWRDVFHTGVADPHNPMIDSKGRVWTTSRRRSAPIGRLRTKRRSTHP